MLSAYPLNCRRFHNKIQVQRMKLGNSHAFILKIKKKKISKLKYKKERVIPPNIHSDCQF